MKLMALSISLCLAFMKGICLNRQADIRVMDCSMALKCLSLRSVGVSVSSAIRITASLQNGIRVLTQARCSLNNSLGSSFWRTSLISIMVIVFGLESEFCFTKIGIAVSTDTAVENISYYFLSPKLHTKWIIPKLFIINLHIPPLSAILIKRKAYFSEYVVLVSVFTCTYFYTYAYFSRDFSRSLY